MLCQLYTPAWQIMALKSGELSGLKVPPQCYSRVSIWLDAAQGPNPALYVYRPQAEQAHQRTPSIVMTAEALLMRQYLGWNRNHPNLTGGADFLLTQLPSIGTTAKLSTDHATGPVDVTAFTMIDRMLDLLRIVNFNRYLCL